MRARHGMDVRLGRAAAVWPSQRGRRLTGAVVLGLAVMAAGCSGDAPDADETLPRMLAPEPLASPTGPEAGFPSFDTPAQVPDQPAVVRSAYRCGEIVFEVEYRDASLRIEGGEGIFFLTPEPVASGARFVADDGRMFWSHGDEATLGHDGEADVECAMTDERSVWAEARERGLSLRAIGQEPGWLLEIHGDDSVAPGRAVFLTMGGEMVEFDDAGTAVSEDAGWTFGEGRYRVRTQDGLCRDTMSGERMERRVTVETPDATYSGCGRRFEDEVSAAVR